MCAHNPHCCACSSPEHVCAQLLCVATGTGVFGCLSGEEGTGLNCFKSYQQCCWNLFLPRQGILKLFLTEGRASLGHTLL